MPKIVIIGAGLTSLSLAYALEQQGFFDYQIFERDDRPGGLLKSFNDQGFTFDHTGHFLHISNAEFASFLQQTIGLETMNKLNRQSFIFSHGVFTPYPFQKNLYNLPKQAIVDCIIGFVARKAKTQNPKNFYQWVLKHFGKGLGLHFFFPYNQKLLNLSPQRLMPSWTDRFVPSTTLEELIAGAIEKKEICLDGYNGSFFYPQIGGIESLVKAIYSKLKNKISCSQEISAIDSCKKIIYTANGQKQRFEKLFSTMPLPHLLNRLDGQHQHNWSMMAKKLHCNHVINFNLGFNLANVSSKHWVYLPEKNFIAYRLGFWHNFALTMAPAGHSSCYGEISVKQNSSKKERFGLEKKAIEQTLEFLGVKEQHLSLKHTHHLEHAYVVYDRWREKNLANLHLELEKLQIYSIGRFGQWKYSSMQEAFLDGQKAAQLVLSDQHDTHKKIKTYAKSP